MVNRSVDDEKAPLLCGSSWTDLITTVRNVIYVEWSKKIVGASTNINNIFNHHQRESL